MSDDELKHYGVRGMKWGQRRSRLRSHDNALVLPLKKKSAKELSNAELNQAINRMRLEKQYKDLNPKGISAGNKAILAVLALGTTANAAFAFASSPAGKAVGDGIRKVISR